MLDTSINMKLPHKSILPKTVIVEPERKEMRVRAVIDRLWKDFVMNAENFEKESCIVDGDIVWALIERSIWWPAYARMVSDNHVEVEFWSDGLRQTCKVGKTVQKFLLANCGEIKERSLECLKRRKKEYFEQFEDDFLKASQFACRGTKRKNWAFSCDDSHYEPARKAVTAHNTIFSALGEEYSSVVKYSQELDSESTVQVPQEFEESSNLHIQVGDKNSSEVDVKQNIGDVDNNASTESGGKCNQQHLLQQDVEEFECVLRQTQENFEHVYWDTLGESDLEVSFTQLLPKRSERSRKPVNYAQFYLSDDEENIRKQKSYEFDSDFDEFDNVENCASGESSVVFPCPSIVEANQDKPTKERINDYSADLCVPKTVQENRGNPTKELITGALPTLVVPQRTLFVHIESSNGGCGGVSKTNSDLCMGADKFEDDRVPDINNPKIFFRKVMKNDFTKSGRLKNENRVYNSLYACPFGCQTLKTNFSTHVLSQQHKAEKEVNEIDMSTDPKERKHKLELLRLKANHKHNKKVLKEGEGQILLSRRSSNICSFNVSKYGPCPMCFEWLLLSFISRHIPTCPANDNRISTTVGDVTVRSKVLSGALTSKASKLLLKEVFPIMRADTVAVVAQSDPLIICLGNEWMDRNVGNKVNRKYYTSSVMRLAARLKMVLNNNSNEPQELKSFISASHFKDICKATMRVAAQDEEDDEEFKAPSNAIKLRYDIIRLANIKLGEGLEEGNQKTVQDARDFLQLMNIRWSNSLARVALLNRKMNLRKPLPLPDDVKILAAYLQKQMAEFDFEEINFKNYSRAVILVLAKLISFNRRRSGEVQATLMVNYKQRIQSVDEISEELIGKMTATERHILNTHDVIEVRGKNAKVVPIIVPPLCRKLLDFIQRHRVECGVRENSIYLFANKNVGVIRGYSALHSVVQEAELKYPERIHSTNLRKYFATLTQSFDLSHQELNHVLDHLGHTLDVHKIHYRQLSPAIERVEIAKLLLVQDLGLLNKYSGKNLKDVNIDEILATHRQNEMDRIEEETVGEDDEELVPDGVSEIPWNVNEECLPDFQDMEIDAEYDENIRIRQPRKSIQRKVNVGRQTPSGRVFFTVEDEKELEELFAQDLLIKHTPNNAQIERKLAESKANNGTIHKYSVSKIKKKISWINNKDKWSKFDGRDASD